MNGSSQPTQLSAPPTPAFQPTLAGQASIKLIGLGGVGSIVARYGAIFLASLSTESRLVFIEGDVFEPGNANRMFFQTCGNKAAVVREELLPYLADSNLTLMSLENYVTPDNIKSFIRDSDIVLLTVDNHATRKLVNDHCATLDNVCLISGGNDGVGPDSSGKFRQGTYGNVQVYLRQEGRDLSPSLTAYHPEIQSPADKLPSDPSCTDLVASVPQIVFANLTTATAMLNTLWLYLCQALPYPELAFDMAKGLMRPVDLPLPRPRQDASELAPRDGCVT